MWFKEYRDYKIDEALVKEKICSGRGLTGCEMHEINGWGNTLHQPKKKRRGGISTLIINLFSKKKNDG